MTQQAATITTAALIAGGATISAGIIMAIVAVKVLRDYMKERDKKNENWIDPRSDRGY